MRARPEVHARKQDGPLKSPRRSADNLGMRLFLPLALLVLSGLPFGASFGDDAPVGPRVGMTRAEFAKLMESRRPTLISEVGGALAIEGGEPGVEFERYEFTQQTPDQPSRIWRITFAYRMSADRTQFEAVEDSLVGHWGAPAERVSRAAEHGEPPYERRVWRSGNVSVTLAGCPDGETVTDATRLQLVTVDRRLEGVAMAERKKAPSPKK